MKRIFSFTLAVFLFLTFFVFPANAVENSAALSFSPADAVSNDDGSMLYLSDKTGKKVYSVNTETFEQKFLSFDLMPESLYFKDDKLYVSLCKQEHDSYWRKEDQSGAFAIIDCSTFTIIAQQNIDTDPYDIVVSNDSIIYITSGSGQWTDIFGFMRDGTVLTNASIRQASTIEYNPILNRIYSITSDSSPRNMNAYSIDEDGNFIDGYDWSYHGDYPMGTNFHISPDGAYILNSSGNVFTCNDDNANDMKFKIALIKGWTDLAFNEAGTKFYTALNNSKQIYAYDYGSFEGTATYETQGYPQYISVKDNTLTAISRETFGGSVFFIETINMAAPQTTIETTITSKPISYDNGCALLSAKSNAKTVFNGNMMYIVDSFDNAVYAIDTAALTETKITFPNIPNSLYYDDGKLFIGFGSNGVVAILDAETFEVNDRLVLGTVFYDVASGKDGAVYIIENFGSSAFSYVRSFSRTTGQQISNQSVYPRSGKLVPHPINNMFYWADTGVSPQDVNALIYEDGVIKAAYDSPYHGEYSIGSRIRISPDGGKIFTSAGSVFSSSSAQSGDMQYINRFTSFTDLVFDLPNSQMFASQSRANLVVYDYTTYESKGFIKTMFPVKEMMLNNGNVITLSSENNVFYLEILDSSNVLQVVPEKINVNTADAVFLTTGGYLNLNPVVLYNDGTSKSVAHDAVYMSSAEAVATVDSSGRLQANDHGYAKITIESDGITKIIDVYVDFDITSISVEGYDINFSPFKTNYVVTLPNGTTEVPSVTFKAPEYVDVTVTPASGLPGTTTLVVTDAQGLFTKTYDIYFYVSAPPVQYDEKPFVINGYYSISNGVVDLSLWVDDNPDYHGAMPTGFSLVIQLMSADAEPILIEAAEDTSQHDYSFSEEYFAVIMVVDKFGQQGYIGIQLAEPKST